MKKAKKSSDVERADNPDVAGAERDKLLMRVGKLGLTLQCSQVVDRGVQAGAQKGEHLRAADDRAGSVV